MRLFSFCVQDNGRLTDASRQVMASVISSLAGKRIKIAVAEWSESPSDKQRKYYFGVIVSGFIEYFKKQGRVYDKDQMHDSMMKSIGGFNNPFVNPFTGLPDEGRLSYQDLTTAQAEGYHTLCRKWAAENGFDIREPNEGEYEA